MYTFCNREKGGGRRVDGEQYSEPQSFLFMFGDHQGCSAVGVAIGVGRRATIVH